MQMKISVSVSPLGFSIRASLLLPKTGHGRTNNNTNNSIPTVFALIFPTAITRLTGLAAGLSGSGVESLFILHQFTL
jgi:hypothetical protein